MPSRTAILENLKYDELMARRCQSLIRQAVRMLSINTSSNYEYGKSITLSNEQLMALTSEELLDMVKDVLSKEHTVLFYGPLG